MSYIDLLTVTDSFEITGRGVVLQPDFSIPQDGWRDRDATVMIVTPSQLEFSATASFLCTHFVLWDPNATADQKNRIVVLLKGVKKQNIPNGSRVLAPRELSETLTPRNE